MPVPEPTVVALAGVAKDAADLLEKVGLLEGIRRKLVNEPELASQKLSIALSEVSVSYELLYRALVRLAHLSFAKEERTDSERFLFELSTGQLSGAIAKAKGHCGVIKNIHGRHLTGLFSRIFRPKRAQELDHLFAVLSDFDNQIMKSLETLNQEGKKIAKEILPLVKRKEFRKAKTRVDRISVELVAPLSQLARGMAKLWSIQADLKVKSGATQ